MSNKIATKILEERGDADGVAEEVLSTTIVLLGLATASLGAVLILMGKFRLADVVAYLPLPGKYLSANIDCINGYQKAHCTNVINIRSRWRLPCIHWLLLFRSRSCIVHQ